MATVKKARCTVRCNDTWVEIQSSTGKIVRVSARFDGGDKDRFNHVENLLLDKLFAVFDWNGPMDLTYDEMGMFAKMAERQKAPPLNGNPAEPNPAITTGRSQSAVPNVSSTPKQQVAFTPLDAAKSFQTTINSSLTDASKDVLSELNLLSQKEAGEKVGRICMVQYDIPETSDYPNPSNIWRKIGFRITLSVWAIRDAYMPWTDIHAMTEAGVEVVVLEFAANEVPKLIALAERNLRRELEEARASLALSIEKAGKQLDGAEAKAIEKDGFFDQEKAVKYHQNLCKGAIKRCEQVAESLEAASRNFGVRPGVGQVLTSVLDTVRGLRHVYEAKALAYVQLAAQAKGTPMEKAAGEGSMPAQVLMDYLEDEGKDVSSQRDLFGS